MSTTAEQVAGKPRQAERTYYTIDTARYHLHRLLGQGLCAWMITEEVDENLPF
jgi:hypothetical protein